LNDHNDHFDIIAKELCNRVNLPYPPIEGHKYKVDATKWTITEEEDFRQWLITYMKTIPRYRRRGIKWIQKTVAWFIFQYGWKCYK